MQNTLPHGLWWWSWSTSAPRARTWRRRAAQPRPRAASLLNAQQNLPIANASGFNYQTSGANSSFNAGQVRMTRRFARGMSGIAALHLFQIHRRRVQLQRPWRHHGTVHRQPAAGARAFHLRPAASAADHLSAVVAGRRARHAAQRRLEDHGADRLDAERQRSPPASGTPLTARVAGNLSNTGGIAAFGTTRAQATGLPIERRRLSVLQPAGVHHAARRPVRKCRPRHHSRACSTCRSTLRLIAPSGFGEPRRSLQLRLSANNALNHVVITGVGTTVNSATYGLPTAASRTRVVTLLLRFSF